MKKRNTLLVAVASFIAGSLAGFALRNSESADYNIEKPEANSKFDESAYFTDDYLKKAKEKRKAEHAANEDQA